MCLGELQIKEWLVLVFMGRLLDSYGGVTETPILVRTTPPNGAGMAVEHPIIMASLY